MTINSHGNIQNQFFVTKKETENIEKHNNIQNLDEEYSHKQLEMKQYVRNWTESPWGAHLSGYAENGDITIWGKFTGRDKSMSEKEVKSFRQFFEDNKVFGLGIFAGEEFDHLFNSTLNIEEFKEKYIQAKEEFETKWREIVQKELEQEQQILHQNPTSQSQNNELSQTKDSQINEDSKKPFKAIEVKSISKTYIQNDFYHNIQQFKNQQMENILSILWEQNSNSTQYNSKKLKEFLKEDSQFDFLLNATFQDERIINSKNVKELLALKKVDIEV
ncbi:hypothetical protein OQH60_05745 [Campylobacter sp. MIT 21-1685]|uniref:hypothetical protein n=1 Tax=unclassified Campylobacter TaxID=2593542 RepID=UPI00224B10BE|nr:MULTISPECIES: hypothetical protein [unclassified Campylobacter]MCX2683425.1 hypothetical protein [Campylobacter sp. MIT 21-1684]MCX2751648.1 hypothetical protein [Campylobacter sp. MIT 21-1682]MCX2807849.1 hypothetical protein [Campylobacter sp. MIT 21-1685]